VEKYHVAQSHTVTATEYPEPLQIDAPASVAPGQPVTLTVRGAGGMRLRYPRLDTADVGWMWFPGDTAAVPNPGWPEGPFDCSTPVCTFTPREGGRMLMWTWVEGALVEAWSDVVRVQTNDMLLNCPDSVQRGISATCTVSAEPGGTLSKIIWEFTDSTGTTTVSDSSGRHSWSGRMAVGGAVHVTGELDGLSLVKTAHLRVTPRTWQTIALRVYQAPGLHLPLQVDSIHHLGDTHLDSLTTYHIRRIDDGPNRGWAYLENPIPEIGQPVHINDVAFAPGSAWYNLQTGGNYTLPSGVVVPNGRCDAHHIPTLKQLTRTHEGLGSSPGFNSHSDSFRWYLQNQNPQVRFEKLIMPPGVEGWGLGDLVEATYADVTSRHGGNLEA
jgi:hypothetical protein